MKKIKAKDIRDVLRKRFDGRYGWIFLEEVGLGYSRIDAIAFNCWGKNEKKAFEIKVSRTDFLQELREPSKREQVIQYVNKYYFVMPRGIASKSEIPKGCGYIEIIPRAYIPEALTYNDIIRLKSSECKKFNNQEWFYLIRLAVSQKQNNNYFRL